MSLVPAFEIGLWNAWILTALLFMVAMVPPFFMSKEGVKKLQEWPPYTKTEKILALATHIFIMPVAAIYSIFLPMELGTVWLYAGLPISLVGGIMMVAAYVNIMGTPPDKPVMKGAYHISRHPLYFGQFLVYVGMGIACASWVLLLLGVAWIVLWQIVLHAEEQGLVEQYGNIYREYMNKTPRWVGIPK